MGNIDENYFKMPSVKHNNSIEEIIGEGEKLLLKIKPKKSAYLFNSIVKFLPMGIIWLLLDGGFLVGMGITNAIPKQFWLFIVPFFAIHMIPVWVCIVNIINACRSWRNLEYAFTERRVIIRSGVIGINIANVYYADIRGVNLKVGFFDRMFKVGDIYISSGKESQVLYDLENPYFILNRIQKIVIDLKTDVYFPNELRPENNSGFKTQYKPEDEN